MTFPIEDPYESRRREIGTIKYKKILVSVYYKTYLLVVDRRSIIERRSHGLIKR